MTVDKLNTLQSALDHDNLLDTAILFAGTCAFFGQLRLGELLATKEGSFDHARSPRLCDVHPPNHNGTRRIHLPYTKVAKHKGEDIILCRQHHRTDPIAAFENHLRV